MQEAIPLFIQYVEEKYENDPKAQTTAYKKLLKDIAYGSWMFDDDFIQWRTAARPQTKCP